jgi:chromosome partitioning protein
MGQSSVFARFAVPHPTAEPRTLAIANQKGGVGKTTTAVNLATALAATGQQVLLIDLDPQGNASTGLGLTRAERRRGTYHLLTADAPLAAVRRPTFVPNLSIVPSDPDLTGSEIELVTQNRREFRLRDALVDADPAETFILLDCPPSLGLLTLNGLTAADGVLVPLQCEFFALEGISHLLHTIDLVRRSLNPQLALQGIVLTMYDRRNNLSELVAADARGFFGDQVYETVIPRNIRISEAPSHGKPVMLYDYRSPGAQAYVRLAAEILRRGHRASPAASPSAPA